MCEIFKEFKNLETGSKGQKEENSSISFHMINPKYFEGGERTCGGLGPREERSELTGESEKFLQCPCVLSRKQMRRC